MKKIVYFVRHGQSEGNVGMTFQSPESPLTLKGREQARHIAERAKSLPFETIISSPLARAKETAEITAKLVGKPLEFSDLFVERIKPIFLNGKPHADPVAAALSKKWEASLFGSGLKADDGENFDDIIARADRALSYLAERPEKKLLVFTHGFFLRTIVAYIFFGRAITGDNLKRLIWRTKTENSGLSVLEFDPELTDPSWRVRVLNDHAHLG